MTETRPQAQDDSYVFNEDGQAVQFLDVLDNDRGGNAKTLWSVYQDDPLAPGNELSTQTPTDTWVILPSGARIKITADGQIAYDYGPIGASIQSLGADDTFVDTFSYSIRLGNGTISTATVNVVIDGENDAADITGDTTGTVVEASTGGPTLSFGEAAVYPAGNFPGPTGHSGLAVADFNDDGNLDIIAAATNGPGMTVLFGDGNGAFTAQPDVAASGPQIALHAKDIDGDFNPDLVLVNAFSVNVYTNPGNGVFGAPTLSFSSGMSFTNDADLADLNGDGKMDLVVVGRGGSTQSLAKVYFGDGDGGFELDNTYSTSSIPDRPMTTLLADIDGDLHKDIVVQNIGNTGSGPFQPNVAILKNDGTGNFGPATNIAQAFNTHVSDMAIGDLNRDERLDIVSATTTGGQVSVLLQDASGNFAETFYSTGAGTTAQGMVLADMNDDGLLDIVSTIINQGQVAVLLNEGGGTFGAPNTFSAGVSPGVNGAPWGLAAADFDEDGLLDLATGNWNDPSLSVLLNTSSGGATDPGTPDASGILTPNDVDNGENKFQAVAAEDLEGTYGNFTFDADTGEWTYTLDNDDPDTQALNTGDTRFDTLVVTSLDGTDTATITVEIHGATDFVF